MLLKTKICFLTVAMIINTCNDGAGDHVYQRMTCDTDYALSEVDYKEYDDVTINVTFHWFSDSAGMMDESLIRASLDTLNLGFANTGRYFDLMGFQEIVSDKGRDMPSYVKYAKQYNVENAMNVYVYNDFQENYTDLKKSVVGASGGTPSTYIAVRKKHLASNTIIHEFGHSLGGLLHIDTQDPDSTGSSSMTGDLVCDTKPTRIVPGEITSDCVYIGRNNLSKEEIVLITCNIMIPFYSKCRGCFTEGQIQRMKWVLENSQDLKKTIKHPILSF